MQSFSTRCQHVIQPSPHADPCLPCACHAALYCHTESYSHDRSVKAAVKQLQRANPALQLKILKDCPF